MLKNGSTSHWATETATDKKTVLPECSVNATNEGKYTFCDCKKYFSTFYGIGHFCILHLKQCYDSKIKRA